MVAAACVVGVVGGAAAVVAVVAARGTRPARGDIPVLLVPGYLGSPATLSDLRERIGATGRTVTAVALPERGTVDMRASAQALSRAVDQTGAGAVDLVGFSAGGIVVRTFLEDLDGAARARRVVLLGAPNHGAEVAELAASVDPSLCTGACAQLTPKSSFLRDLNAGDETPGDASYTSVWTDRDSTVTPPSSAVLAGATNVRLQDVCPGSLDDHGDLIHDSLPVGLVAFAVNGKLSASSLPSCTDARAAGA